MLSLKKINPKVFVFIFALLFVFFSQQPSAFSSEAAANTSAEKLSKVAEAILNWDGKNPGEMFQKVKEANPDKNAIDSVRELNAAIADGIMPPEVTAKAEALKTKQNQAQESVRERVKEVREKMFLEYLKNNPEKARSLYGIGDIGSWTTTTKPDASMDIDWTVFGVDPDVTADARDEYIRQLTADLDKNDSGLTLKDFDVVVTAEGHEKAAGVFESEGGIDWAKRNMKSFTVLQLDGSTRTYNLETRVLITKDGKRQVVKDGVKIEDGAGTVVKHIVGDPIAEMSMASQLAEVRKAATEGGDYEKMFDEKGFILQNVFLDADQAAEANALWEKYGDMLKLTNVDYYRTRMDTATGGALDMSKHLNEEVLKMKFEPDARMRKTLKYLYRADNITRKGEAQLRRAIEADPLLSDPAYQKAIALSYEVTQHPETVKEVLAREYGSTPDAALQQLGETSKKAILRMAEVAYQVEMDRIIMEIPTAEGRKAALDKLAGDFGIIADEGGEYADLSKFALDSIAKVQEVNDSGALDGMKKDWKTLDQIRHDESGVTKQALDYLQQTELGRKMLENGGKFLKWGSQNVYEKAQGKFKSDAVDFIGELVDSARGKTGMVVDIAGSLSMWVEVLNNVRNAKSDADLAYALGQTLVNNTFFGMIMSTAYAGVVQGDNEALAKAIMYMIVPETALPALVESLGNAAINLGSQMSFEAQLDALYIISECGKEGKMTSYFDGAGTDIGAVRELINDFLGDGGAGMAEDMIKKSKTYKMERAQAVNVFMKSTVVKAMESTILKGNPLLFTEDGPLMNACAKIRTLTEEIDYLAKTFGFEMHFMADENGSWSIGLDAGQTNAINKLITRRKEYREQSKEAFAQAIVRTFDERCRAEQQIGEGQEKAFELLKKLEAIFDRLNIKEKGMASLEAEGAPYNLISGWMTSTEVKQRNAMIALQKFLDTYTRIEEVRTAAETLAARILGEGRKLTPRPLTGSLPLTASPDRDLAIARAYLQELSSEGEKCIKLLEAKKHGELAGEYDQNALRTLYAYRVRYVYWKSYREAATQAKELHWKSEIYDRLSLDAEREKAYEEQTVLNEKEKALLDEFEKHYDVDGKIDVTLEAPSQVNSGETVELKAILTLNAGEGLPPEILSQISYEWKQGKVDLGGKTEATRSFRLDTPGDQTFSVKVERTTRKAGKKVLALVGEKTVTINVLEASQEDKPTETEKTEGKEKFEEEKFEKEKAEKARLEKEEEERLEKEQAAEVEKLNEESERLQKEREQKEIERVKAEMEKAEKERLASEQAEQKKRDKEEAEARKKRESVPGYDETDDVMSPNYIQKKFAGTVSSAWEGGADGQKFGFRRKKAEYKNPHPHCTKASVTGTVSGKLSTSYDAKSLDNLTKGFDAEVKEHKRWGKKAEIKSISIAGLSGKMVETEVRFKGGSGSPLSGYRDSGTTVSAHGFVVKGYQSIEFDYSVYGGGCWNNTDRAFQESQVRAGQAEAKAILSSLTLVKDGDFTVVPYKGPKMDGSDLATVHLSPESLAKLKVGDAAAISAVVENGQPEDSPFTYHWTGEVTGEGQSVQLNAKGPGKFSVTVSVDGARYPIGTASLEYEVEDFKVSVERVPNTDKSIPIGSSIGLKATLLSGESPAKGEYVYRWQPHPEVTFKDLDSTSNQTTATFTRLGGVKVWVVVLKKEGDTLATVAESDQIEIDVTKPKLTLTATPPSPLVGEVVTLKAVDEPAMDDSSVSFWWETDGNTMSAGAHASEREYKYIPKDTKPVTVTVHAKGLDAGDDLGEQKLTITAKPYEVTVSKPKARGVTPRIWQEGKGLVEVEQGIAVYQDVTVSAEVSPAPKNLPLGYQWKISPEGCRIYSPGSKETTVNADKTGSYTLTVLVTDSKGIELGTGTGSVSVTISQEQMDIGKKKTEEVKVNLAKAKEASNKGKLDEAIVSAKETLAADPNNAEAKTFLDQTKAEKEKADKSLAQVDNLIRDSDFTKAQEALIPLKNKYPYYPPVQKMDKDLGDAWRAHTAKVNEAMGDVRVNTDKRDYAEALEAIEEARKLKLLPSELKTLSEQENYLRPLVAKKEKAKELFVTSKAKFESGDYQGCIDDYLEGFNLTPNMWNINSDDTIHKAEEIYRQAMAKKKQIDELLKIAQGATTVPAYPQRVKDFERGLEACAKIKEIQPQNEAVKAIEVKLKDLIEQAGQRDGSQGQGTGALKQVRGAAVSGNTEQTITLNHLGIQGSDKIRIHITELSGQTSQGKNDSARIGEVEFYDQGKRVMPKKASAESTYKGYSPQQAMDGDPQYAYFSNGARGWASEEKSAGSTSWIEFVFDAPVNVDKIVVTTAPSNPYRLHSFEIQSSLKGVEKNAYIDRNERVLKVVRDENIIVHHKPEFNFGDEHDYILDGNESLGQVKLVFDTRDIDFNKPQSVELLVRSSNTEWSDSAKGFNVYCGEHLIGKSGRVERNSSVRVPLDVSKLSAKSNLELILKAVSADGLYIYNQSSGHGPELIIKAAEGAVYASEDLKMPSGSDGRYSAEQVARVKGFEGQWKTGWGNVVLNVDGINVTGTYPHDKGKIKAALSSDGKSIVGTWSEAPSYKMPKDAGKMSFTLSEDQKSFIGKWGYGEADPTREWNGTLIGPVPAAAGTGPGTSTIQGSSTSIWDFESGNLNGWTATGDAFEFQPTYGDNPTARNRGQASNHQGDYWIGGYEKRPTPADPAGHTQGDMPQGTLTSPSFSITSNSLNFLIGGGCDLNVERLELLIDGDAVLKATGKCNETMERATWDVSNYLGRNAQLRIVDQSSGGWGHINFDDFRAGAAPGVQLNKDNAAAMKASDLAGKYFINANGYKGSLFLRPEGSGFSGMLNLGKAEELIDIRLEGESFTFTRPIPGVTQVYTGTVSGVAGNIHLEGTFTSSGITYNWFADMTEPSPKTKTSEQSHSRISGKWNINANGYGGILTLSGPTAQIKGVLSLGGGDEQLTDLSFDGATLIFTRPLPGFKQIYTGKLSGSGFLLHLEGAFTQNGEGAYHWFADMQEPAY